MAARVVKRRVVAATATIRQGGRATRVSFTLTAGKRAAKAKAFWTDGHLQCSQDGSGAPPAYLTQPDFTTKSPTPISTRGWIAWYTAQRRLALARAPGAGTPGRPRSAASRSSIPAARRRRSRSRKGPVSVPAGQGIHTVGVYEIVYWVGGRPDYQWQYVNAGTTGAAAAGTGNLYCAYA